MFSKNMRQVATTTSIIAASTKDSFSKINRIIPPFSHISSSISPLPQIPQIKSTFKESP
jgi:hypothetical protein